MASLKMPLWREEIKKTSAKNKKQSSAENEKEKRKEKKTTS